MIWIPSNCWDNNSAFVFNKINRTRWVTFIINTWRLQTSWLLGRLTIGGKFSVILLTRSPVTYSWRSCWCMGQMSREWGGVKSGWTARPSEWDQWHKVSEVDNQFNILIHNLHDGAECILGKLPSTWILTGWRNGHIRTWCSARRSCKSYTWGRNKPKLQYILWAHWPGSFTEKDWRFLMDTNLNMSQQCTLMAKEVWWYLGLHSEKHCQQVKGCKQKRKANKIPVIQTVVSSIKSKRTKNCKPYIILL